MVDQEFISARDHELVYNPTALVWLLATYLQEGRQNQKSALDWINYAAKALDVEGVTNLGKAKLIVTEIGELREVQRALKASFAHRELDGGAPAALTHPLYLEAERRLAELDEQLTILI